MNIVKRPQFLFTYYNPFDSHKNNLGNAFLDYVKDVNLANYSSEVVGKFIEQQTEEQLKAIENMTSEVAMLGEDIRDGFSKINQRLTLIHVEQLNTNLLLKDIKHILKQPDSEKQRMKHIEFGLKFFNQALKDEDLILDAVEEFDKAFALMKQDWFTSYQLGLCHTFYKAVQDLSKAEAYFLNAAKYASVDTLVVNDFNEAFYKSISLTKNDNNNLSDFAAECYLQIALIKYIQSDFAAAVLYAKKATSLSPNNAKTFFLRAKYLSRLGENYLAIESLKIANSLDKSIYKLFPKDIDILKNSLFADYYQKIKNELLKTKNLVEKENRRIDELIQNKVSEIANQQESLKTLKKKIEENEKYDSRLNELSKNSVFNVFIGLLAVFIVNLFLLKLYEKIWIVNGFAYWFFSVAVMILLSPLIIPTISSLLEEHYKRLIDENNSEKEKIRLEVKTIEKKISNLQSDISYYQSQKNIFLATH